MGVERAVTRWYVHRQRILEEVALLESKLAPQGEGAAPDTNVEEVQKELTRTQEQLRLLGPCPKPMMG